MINGRKTLLFLASLIGKAKRVHSKGYFQKSIILGPCGNRLYWDPARRHSPGPRPALGPGSEARPRAGPCASGPGRPAVPCRLFSIYFLYHLDIIWMQFGYNLDVICKMCQKAPFQKTPFGALRFLEHFSFVSNTYRIWSTNDKQNNVS